MGQQIGELVLPNGQRLSATYSLTQSGDRVAGQLASDFRDIDTGVLWSGVTLITEDGRGLKILMTSISDRGAPFVGIKQSNP